VAFIGDENADCAPAFLLRKGACAVQKRRRFKQTQSLEERLADEATELRKVAETLAPGSERDSVLRKARQDETALHMTEWLNSSGLKPPT
jgi:hypothetical protein